MVIVSLQKLSKNIKGIYFLYKYRMFCNFDIALHFQNAKGYVQLLTYFCNVTLNVNKQ